MTKAHSYTIIGAPGSTTTWTGAPTTIVQPNGLAMSPTTNGSMVIAYQNTAAVNNAGKLILTSGGSQPMNLVVPALLQQPTILVNNWGGNNLNVTNLSVGMPTPIWLEAFGPGLPGQTPIALPLNTPTTLAPAIIAQGTANPNYMQLAFTTMTGTLTVVAVIGGPPDSTGNNAYVIALNSASGNTGPGFGPAPQGYYATTGGNTYSMEFNWGSSVVYVANMSPSTAAPVSVNLISL